MLKIEPLFDLAFALLGIYPNDTDVVKRRGTRTPMSTTAKLWKEPRCPATTI